KAGRSWRGGSRNGAELLCRSAVGVEAKGGDAIELGLLARVLFRFFALLVAFVEHLDLLELLEGFAQRRLGVLKLDAQLVGRVFEILAPRRRGLGIGRVGEMRGIVDTGTILLDLDLALELTGNAVELGDHRFDLGDLAPLFVDLELLQTDKSLA